MVIQAGQLIAKAHHSYFTRPVWFEFLRQPVRQSAVAEFLNVNGREVPLILVRNPRARRYLLRLRPDGSARVTVPRGGSVSEARRFAERSKSWLERALQQLATQPARRQPWALGTAILFRGEPVEIEADVNAGRGQISFGTEALAVTDTAADLRAVIERQLWRLAAKEFPPRVQELAAAQQLLVRRVTVRNQRSRWGSCSRRGTISLNWRLIQSSRMVQDYVILHELMHLREMNHSARFWRQVANVCPDHATAERWLKENASLLR